MDTKKVAEDVKVAAAETAKKAAAVKKSVEKAAEPAVKAVKKAAEPAAKAVKKAAEPAAKAVKKAAEPAAKAVKKVADDAKKTVAKAVKKEAAANVVLQFAGREVAMKDVLEAAKKAYAASNKAAIKDITLYVKPEDNAAYYVVNGDVTGKIEL